MDTSDLRDRIADALVAELRRAVVCAPPGGIGILGPTEFDLADTALRVVQPALDRIAAERDGAYRERAQLLAEFATRYEAYLAYTDPDVPTWPVLTVETPTGQMCWHINSADLDLFGHVTWVDPVAIGWDGHTTEEKYQRLAALVSAEADRG